MTMSQGIDAREFQERLQRLNNILLEMEQSADPAVQARIRSVVQALLDLYGTGLERILGHLSEAGAAGSAVLEACSRDEIVGGLLLLHGLHPLDVQTRVIQALDEVRPRLRSHGGDVEFLSVTDGVIRLRLVGNCHGCPSSTATMKGAIEEAILAHAPDATAVQVDGAIDLPATTPDGRPLVLLSAL